MTQDDKSIGTLNELSAYLKQLQFSFEGDSSGKYTYDDIGKIPLFPNQYLYISSLRSLKIEYKRDIEKVLGYKESKFTPTFLYQLIHPDQRQQVMEATRLSFEYAFAFELFSYDYSFSMDFKCRHKDNRYRYILRQSSFFEFDENNVPVSILSICTDISNHKIGDSIGWQVFGVESQLTDLTGLLSNIQIKGDELLSEREIEIVRCLARGNSSKEIGEELFISSHTVDTHRRKILKKLGLKNVVELVMFALRQGYLEK